MNNSMNTPANSISDFDSQKLAPAAPAPTRPFYWSVRRELWEYRSIYIAPLAVGALTVFGYFVATIGRALSTPNLEQRLAILQEPYTFAAGVIMAAGFLVGIFYSLDALHGERRDRSILFWKSLPVSDLTTVLAKASIPLVVVPALGMAIVIVTTLLMRLMGSFALMISGLNATTAWDQSPLSHMWFLLIYHLITVHVLWHAPIYAWFLLVSGWARRAPFLWAILPWFALAGVEKIAFHTNWLLRFMAYRFAGPEEFSFGGPGHASMEAMRALDPAQFFASFGLWIGLIVAAALLLATARMRRDRAPI